VKVGLNENESNNYTYMNINQYKVTSYRLDYSEGKWRLKPLNNHEHDPQKSTNWKNKVICQCPMIQ
jgi:hypothetical protein